MFTIRLYNIYSVCRVDQRKKKRKYNDECYLLFNIFLKYILNDRKLFNYKILRNT